MEYYTKIPDKICTIPGFADALEIVKENSQGKIWAIGGVVYNTIINEKYGTLLPAKDFDFLVEEIKLPIILKDGTVEVNNYGSYKIKLGAVKIDVVPLSNVHSIQRKNISPSIENYLLGTPFTVQSIAFDIENKKIIGEKSIRSIENRIIEINDREEAIFAANVYTMTLSEYMVQVAQKLDFKYEDLEGILV